MRPLYKGSTAFYQVLWVTPFANTLLKDFAIEALQEEGLGKDEIPDFLCVSFSSPDVAGHTFGPQSVEVQDMYLRLDRDIAHLLRVLDRKVGKGEYTVFLTSDHGVSPVVSYALKNNQPAGLVVLPRIEQNLSFFLNTKYGARDWISNVADHQIYLNRGLLAEHGVSLTEMQRSVADFLKEQPGVRFALTAGELEDKTMETDLPAMLQKGYLPERSGDVLMAYEPGFSPTYDFRTPIEKVRGAGHGSGYPPDTHVPLLWMGKGIPQGESSRLVHPTDIAPTLAKILGLEEPAGMSGRLLEELLGE
jgi:predicted AlkP superfamily pyrophosphatase or phosphodiesterase